MNDVTDAAENELLAYSKSIFGRGSLMLSCPSCGKEWPVKQESAREHAAVCTELRSDIAGGL